MWLAWSISDVSWSRRSAIIDARFCHAPKMPIRIRPIHSTAIIEPSFLFRVITVGFFVSCARWSVRGFALQRMAFGVCVYGFFCCWLQGRGNPLWWFFCLRRVCFLLLLVYWRSPCAGEHLLFFAAVYRPET